MSDVVVSLGITIILFIAIFSVASIRNWSIDDLLYLKIKLITLGLWIILIGSGAIMLAAPIWSWHSWLENLFPLALFIVSGLMLIYTRKQDRAFRNEIMRKKAMKKQADICYEQLLPSIQPICSSCRRGHYTIGGNHLYYSDGNLRFDERVGDEKEFYDGQAYIPSDNHILIYNGARSWLCPSCNTITIPYSCAMEPIDES